MYSVKYTVSAIYHSITSDISGSNEWKTKCRSNHITAEYLYEVMEVTKNQNIKRFVK